MKKFFTITTILVLFLNLKAQEQPEISIDSMLVNIDKTSLNTNIIYNRTYSWANLSVFNDSINVSNLSHFKQSVNDLYKSSNEEVFYPYKCLGNIIENEDDPSIVTIGIINATLYQLNYNSENEEDGGLKIIDNKFEKINNNKPSFNEKQVFIASTLKENIRGEQITFRFNENLFLEHSPGKEIQTLVVNFDTNAEYTVINNGNLTNNDITIQYTEDGYKELTFTATFVDGSTKTTFSTIYVKTTPPPPGLITLVSDYPYQGYLNDLEAQEGEIYGQIEYRVFNRFINGDPNNQADNLMKPIIIIDGFDPEDKR